MKFQLELRTLLAAMALIAAMPSWSLGEDKAGPDKAGPDKAGPDKATQADKKPRLFEMRTYTANDGKFEALHARFRDHTNRLFVKHGMTLVGYWTPTDGPRAKDTLVYILAYPDREAREKSWKAFLADPDWQKAYKESHQDGPLVKKVDAQFLNPTDYSPIK